MKWWFCWGGDGGKGEFADWWKYALLVIGCGRGELMEGEIMEFWWG